MSKRRAIGRALSGFAETYLPAMQAMQDRRYQEAMADKARAEADQILQRQELLDMFMSGELEETISGTPEESSGMSPEELQEYVKQRRDELGLGDTSILEGLKDPDLAKLQVAMPDILASTLSPISHMDPEGRPLPSPIPGSPISLSQAQTVPIRPDREAPVLDPLPTFKGGVQRASRKLEAPDRYDPRDMRFRQIFGASGMPSGGIDALLGPLHETDEWEIYEKTRDQLRDRAIAIESAGATTVESSDLNGMATTEYVNMDALLNPWAREFLIDNNLWRFIGTDPVGAAPAHGGDPIEASTANEQSLQLGGESSNDLFHSAKLGVGLGNFFERIPGESPLGRPSIGPLGGISVAQLTADQQKHLMQLSPVATVTLRIIDLAKTLNTEEKRYLAIADGWREKFNSLVGSNDPVGTVAGDASDLRDAEYARRALEAYNLQRSDKVVLLERLRNAFAGLYAELGGERGRKTEEDVARAKDMIMGVGTTAGLTNEQSRLILTNLINTFRGITQGPISAIPIGQLEQELAALTGRQIGGATGGLGGGTVGAPTGPGSGLWPEGRPGSSLVQED
jgi:hypothetical protein